MTDRPTPAVQEPLAPGVGDGGGPLPPGALTDAERRERLETAGWQTAGVLYRNRWRIIGLSFLAAVVAAGVSLVLPKYYAASARVLIPDSSSGGLASVIGDLSPLARGVLGGGGGGDYSRYLAILTSRSVLEQAVDRFNLVDRYDLAEEEHPREAALEELRDNVSFEVDLELEFLRITALDRDPEQAAALANFLTETLNERNAELSIEGARAFREYVETRYAETEAALDSARIAMQAFQERNGIVELPTMAQAYVEALAAQRAEVAQLEIQYEALASQYGPENEDVALAAAALRAARQSEGTLLAGQDRAVPLSLRNLPSLGSRYAALYQEVLIQAQVLEAARPILEQARFDEARERVAVQVVDPAVPPVKKATPKRTVIVLVTGISAFVLACLLFLALDAGRRHGGAWRTRLADA